MRIGSASSRPHETRTPTLGETLMRVMQMADRRTEEDASARTATVTVTPDTCGVGLLEFHQIDWAREAGLQAGQVAVAALHERGPAKPASNRPCTWHSRHAVAAVKCSCAGRLSQSAGAHAPCSSCVSACLYPTSTRCWVVLKSNIL